MDILEAVARRHSVRAYTDKKIEGEVLNELLQEIKSCNQDSGLNFQLITDKTDVFTGTLAKKVGFKGAHSFIAVVGKKSDDLEEKCGYFGEKIVLKAQMLGLNTCWVVGTFNRRKAKASVKMDKNEKLVCVIAIGYGENQGKPHTSTLIDFLFRIRGDMPSWFMEGVQCALLAPTAMNKQKFRFRMLEDNKIKAELTSKSYGKINLGIVKLHFEIGAGDAEYEFV